MKQGIQVDEHCYYLENFQGERTKQYEDMLEIEAEKRNVSLAEESSNFKWVLLGGKVNVYRLETVSGFHRIEERIMDWREADQLNQEQIDSGSRLRWVVQRIGCK